MPTLSCRSHASPPGRQDATPMAVAWAPSLRRRGRADMWRRRVHLLELLRPLPRGPARRAHRRNVPRGLLGGRGRRGRSRGRGHAARCHGDACGPSVVHRCGRAPGARRRFEQHSMCRLHRSLRFGLAGALGHRTGDRRRHLHPFCHAVVGPRQSAAGVAEVVAGAEVGCLAPRSQGLMSPTACSRASWSPAPSAALACSGPVGRRRRPRLCGFVAGGHPGHVANVCAVHRYLALLRELARPQFRLGHRHRRGPARCASQTLELDALVRGTSPLATLQRSPCRRARPVRGSRVLGRRAVAAGAHDATRGLGARRWRRGDQGLRPPDDAEQWCGARAELGCRPLLLGPPPREGGVVGHHRGRPGGLRRDRARGLGRGGRRPRGRRLRLEVLAGCDPQLAWAGGGQLRPLLVARGRAPRRRPLRRAAVPGGALRGPACRRREPCRRGAGLGTSAAAPLCGALEGLGPHAGALRPET
mmetsp:Transcript_112962/g.326341  ORF Transcript_112962/g.326341 Transcript_112962/m.326341 type:complete len:474 (+) Transcript_112962:86-1507(+)